MEFAFNKSRFMIDVENIDVRAVIIIAFGLTCDIMLSKLTHVSFATFGVVVCAAVQVMRHSRQSSWHLKAPAKRPSADIELTKITKTMQATEKLHKPDYRFPSMQPVSAPSFVVEDFDEQVRDLVGRIVPSAEGDIIVQKLVCAVRRALVNLFPESEITGFVSGDVSRRTAFAVAIPPIDIVLKMTPAAMADKLRQVFELGERDLRMTALKVCTDALITGGGFRFRRSAFKNREPKVTLLAPASMGIHSNGVALNFSINTASAIHSVALLAESGQIDARAGELILLVRRWAKDRGISHDAKRHLCPYAWTILTIYFLQVSTSEMDPILPALTEIKLSSEYPGRKFAHQQQGRAEQQNMRPQKPTASLLREFFKFYKEFDWGKEGVAVRCGKRVPRGDFLPLRILLDENTSTIVAPSVADPFVPRQNLAIHMTILSIGRLHEELARADELCSRRASLSELFEPWVPAHEFQPKD
eukprot:TRINITY_DN10994_c0_g2_i1.p1 TRINITY_DN10994_c0_g2~~TRINITY_DN10994_c0_g2_i1.p1  ORF type:complete len:516 (-),score=64.41 TRINITY_DN10994_c0_g2_i1:156-1574(-)